MTSRVVAQLVADTDARLQVLARFAVLVPAASGSLSARVPTDVSVAGP